MQGYRITSNVTVQGYLESNGTGLQGYLAHKRAPTPWDRYRALGIALLLGSTRRRFRMGEVPPYLECKGTGLSRMQQPALPAEHKKLNPTKVTAPVGGDAGGRRGRRVRLALRVET